MKTTRTSLAALGLSLLAVACFAAPVTYPGPPATDTAGVAVTSGVTDAIVSVVDLNGNAIASPGAVAHVAGGNPSVVYDAGAKSEAWITYSLTASGHTFSNVTIFCSADPQTLAANNTLATDIKAKTDQLAFDGSGYVNSHAKTVDDKTGYTATASNLPSDYARNNVSPSWYSIPPTGDQIAAKLLLTPANLIATDSSGRVTTSNPATGGGGTDPLVNTTASYTTPGTVGYYIAQTVARRSDLPTDYQQRGQSVTLPTTVPTTFLSTDATVAALPQPADFWNYTIETGYTAKKELALVTSVTAFKSIVTYPDSTHQVSGFYSGDGTTLRDTSTLTKNSSGQITLKTFSIGTLP